MTTEINFTGKLITSDKSSSARVNGTIYLRAEPSGMKSWDGFLYLNEIDGNMPLLPDGELLLEDGRRGRILTTHRSIESDTDSSGLEFQGTGPLA